MAQEVNATQKVPEEASPPPVRLANLQWQRHLVLKHGTGIFVRRIRPDDELLIRNLLVQVNKEDLRLRFFDSIKEFSHLFTATLLGVDWICSDSIRESGEYAILLRSDV
jgi:hypothetical protein